MKKVYLNGRIVAASKATVSVFDRGLCYGDGLFETIRAFRGTPEFLCDHLERLESGASAIGLPLKPVKALFKDIREGALERLLKANGLAHGTASIKITITRGESERGVLPPRRSTPTVIMAVWPVDEKVISRRRRLGVRAVMIEGYRPQIPGVKTLNYLPNVLASIEAKKRGALEGIFKGPDNSLLEGTATNLFVVAQGVLMTPPVNENPLLPGVLPGVMRKAVMGLAGRLGIRVMAVRLTEDDLTGCDEAFLTNSIAGVMPLISVDSTDLSGGRPGPMTLRLQDSLETMRG